MSKPDSVPPIRRWPEHALAAVLAILLFAPVLRPGYVLSYDLVATPHLPFTPATLGWGDGLPRAVPQDAVVAVLTTVLPGWLVELAALVAGCWLAVVGAARLVPSQRLVVRLIAGAGYGWNAFVAERLVIGHWGLLLGYAALPWLVRAALAARVASASTRARGEARRAGARVVGWAALAALTPTGGLLAAVTAAVLLCWPRTRGSGPRTRGGWPRTHGGWWALAVAALNAPWLVAGLVASASARSDGEGVAAFAARAENWSGPLGALLGLGGIWNAEVVPASRTSAAAPLFTVLVVVVAVAGAAPLGRHWGRRQALAFGSIAAGALVVAAAGALPGGPTLLTALVERVPGGGLLRDGQKFLPPYALLLAICFALGVERLTHRLDPTPTQGAAEAPGRRTAGLVAAGAAMAALLFPVLALPDLAWGAAGRLATAHYPGDWDRVAGTLESRVEAGRTGVLVALPFSAFRAFPWTGGRTVLDPAPRYFPVDVVVEDALPVSAGAVGGESQRAAAVRTALRDGRSLAAIGVRWVVVERQTPGPVPPTALAGFRVLWSGQDLILYEATGAVPGRSEETTESVLTGAAEPTRVAAVLSGYALAIGVVLWALVTFAATYRTSRLSVVRTGETDG